jgi:hypothetical protein
MTSTSIVVASRSLVSSDLGEGERIILSTEGIYFGLDGVASFIWDLIQEPVSIADVCDAVVTEFEVDAARAADDVTGFVDGLIQNDLAKVVHAETSGGRRSRRG